MTNYYLHYQNMCTVSILQYNNKMYNCVLGLVDIVKGTNSYYKLQVLESDSKKS